MVFKIKSFEEIADEWLEYKKISIKKSTYYNYMFIIEKYLKKNFSNFNIKNINNYNIKKEIQRIERKIDNYSKKIKE